ncbi:MAG: aminomethyltransferase, partial [Pseudomonadota bacterium]
MPGQSFIEHPWEKRGVIAPGLPILPPGVERHPVPGGGSRAVPVFRGDEVSVLNKEGLQPAELVMFTPDGRSDAGLLGREGRGRPERTIATLARGGASGARVLKALAAAGFDIAQGDAVQLFDTGSRAGDAETLHAESDGLLICAAPGGPMAPEEQSPPTELMLYIRRADPKAAKEAIGP